jgi:hypothetical protein
VSISRTLSAVAGDDTVLIATGLDGTDYRILAAYVLLVVEVRHSCEKAQSELLNIVLG